MDNVLQLAAAFSGSMGFALLFQVRRGKLLLASPSLSGEQNSAHKKSGS